MVACFASPVISSINFTHFRVLEHATLPLGAFNLMLGPNGSGKTTAVRALLTAGEAARALFAGGPPPRFEDLAGATIELEMAAPFSGERVVLRFDDRGNATTCIPHGNETLAVWLSGIRGYTIEPDVLARPVPAGTSPQLQSNGAGFPALLLALHQSGPARWEEFLAEVRRVLPEVSDVHVGVTAEGQIAFSVTRTNALHLHARHLSQGTLMILALTTLALASERPTFLSLEEIERGIHPRLLREVRDLLYRLSFPGDAGDEAAPVQVLTTTHSPFVLDLFRDTPEDVVLATREGESAVFRRLADVPELQEMLEEGRLGDLWYSGVLGSVP